MRVLELNVHTTAILALTHLCGRITAIPNALCTSHFTPTGGVHAAAAAAAAAPWIHSEAVCLPDLRLTAQLAPVEKRFPPLHAVCI